jgi:hypothetical protein
MKSIVGLMRWPFPEGTTVYLADHKLPEDCAFVRILKVEEPYVYLLLASQTWVGQREDDEIIPPQFKYESKGGTIAIPKVEEILRGARN